MVCSTETVDLAVLRLRVGVNHFKKYLLGDRHIAGQAQTQLVMEELNHSPLLASRTWASWFEHTPPRPRVGTIANLDRCASSFLPCGMKVKGENFYQELIAGGLVHRLLAPTESKSSELVLRQRAAEYKPQTSLHLHLDAIEVASLFIGNGAVGWDVVKMIATSRIAEILHLLWNHHSGSMYSALVKEAGEEGALAMDSLQNDSGLSLDAQLDQVARAWRARPRKPNQEATAGHRGLSAEQVYRTLLALAADVELLQGKVFETWWLDLASAALVLHSSSWVNRYEIFTDLEAPEVIYLDALQSVYFRPSTLEETVRFSIDMRDLGKFPWDIESFALILSAQSAYRALLSELALSPAMVEAAYFSCEAAHPIIFYGNLSQHS